MIDTPQNTSEAPDKAIASGFFLENRANKKSAPVIQNMISLKLATISNGQYDASNTDRSAKKRTTALIDVTNLFRIVSTRYIFEFRFIHDQRFASQPLKSFFFYGVNFRFYPDLRVYEFHALGVIFNIHFFI